MQRLQRIITWTCLLAVLPSTALAWGSVAPAQTHQHILREAYRLLRTDPAYNADLFPTEAETAAHEGVEWTAIGLVGNSPDAAGKTRYSEHYYNPVTARGEGPASAAKYYGYLARGMLLSQKQKEATAKAAAWGAHFLADMCVPYHVVGMPRSEAIKTFDAQLTKHPGAVFIGFNVLGSPKLLFKTVSPLQNGQVNFVQSYTRFRDRTEPTEVDWYDPWYYNGITDLAMVTTSSHLAWEATPKHVPTTTRDTAPTFKNAAPTFKEPWAAQALRIQTLAKDTAKVTRTELEKLYDKPEPGIDRAVQAVYTAWRASFSAMRPTLSHSQNPDGTYRIVARLKNTARGGVTGINARLSVAGGTAREATSVGKVNAIGSGLEKEIKVWNVKAARADSALTVKVEVIGTFKEPDLQYAYAERTIDAEEPDVQTMVKLSPEIKDGNPNLPVELKATVTGLARSVKQVGYKLYATDSPSSLCCNYKYNDAVSSGLATVTGNSIVIPLQHKLPKAGKYHVSIEIYDGPPPNAPVGGYGPPNLLANAGISVELNPQRACPCEGFDPNLPQQFAAACSDGRCVAVEGRVVTTSSNGCSVTIAPHEYYQKKESLPASMNLTMCGRSFLEHPSQFFRGKVNANTGIVQTLQ